MWVHLDVVPSISSRGLISKSTFRPVCVGQLEDPAIRWQMALYRDYPNHCEDAGDPEKTVERVLDIAHVLFYLDQVCVV